MKELIHGELSDISENFKSNLLRSLVTVESSETPNSKFPELQDIFTDMSDSFERSQAKTEGNIS